MEQIHLVSILFITAFIIQYYFLFRYFLSFVNKKPSLSKRPKGKQAVSVIICAHNELKNLQENLLLFLNQEFEDFEVIVVNDRSNDGSAEYLDKQVKLFPILKTVPISSTPIGFNPKKYAITEGIEAAKNDIILLSDADCYPASAQWIDRMSQCFTTSTSIVLGASLYEKRKGFLNQFIRFETLQTALLYLSFAFKKEPYMGVGRNIGYRKSFFLAKNGFQGFRSLMGGDDDIWVNRYANKENTQICTQAESLTFSNPKESWGSFFLQKKRHLSVGKYYKSKDKMKLGLFHLSQAMLWILFILGLMLGNPTVCLILSFLILMHLVGQYVVFYHLSINFGIRFMHYNLPTLEILFVLYYWIWGIYASLTKHLKWK
ncbi:Glycosyltransferase, catalytic subunit of cellulose synthase and poly-beta-1,6-N-acetylglucosamine synthase [Marivirga sericea]|uniref:Glycosyltransferase, catalytic subunit of cellulose synthase and poly-beta-1,6-N-acetylglucosamine synthase n=1 Tax=Marivirga sericea TaxID=1028 RepID=A0A1X7IKV4_9BACT|nr:glycosyltransferase [Marivirga sericea]SMG15494.1 Glycosyltransferase, catalytic subunit of cellulose synthase and poly-beta-1,6-N-acetylglucosamine synthase [Marivirga sericea]